MIFNMKSTKTMEEVIFLSGSKQGSGETNG